MAKRKHRYFVKSGLVIVALLMGWFGAATIQKSLLEESRRQLSLAEKNLSEGNLKAARQMLVKLEADLSGGFLSFHALPSIKRARNEIAVARDNLQARFQHRLAATQAVLSETAALIESGKIALAREKIRGALSLASNDPTLNAMAKYVDRFGAQNFKEADDIIPALDDNLPEELTVDEFAKTLSRLVEMEKKANRESQARIAAAVKSAIRSAARESAEFTPEVRGRVMVWDHTKGEVDQTYEILPDELRASARDSTVTIFSIIEREQVVQGYYSISGQPGYQEKMKIGVVYWPRKVSPGTAIVWGGAPAHTRVVSHTPEYGSAIKIKEWIARLPQK